MMSANFGLVERPSPLMVSVCCWPLKTGGVPTWPAAPCTFCSRSAWEIVGGDVQRVHAVRTQPDAHAVVARAEHLHLPDARQARQRLAHLVLA
jgi:hypothetical protein